MEKSKHTAWLRHFDAIGDELLRLTTICDVNLREPDVIERILKNDETVCGKRNPIGFRKLRELLMATFNSLGKAMDRLGTDEVRKITQEIRERLDARRALAQGRAAPDPNRHS
jgi:hypothetical protein